MRQLWFIAVAAVVAPHGAEAAELSTVELKDGRQLYHAKCAKCHKSYDPAIYRNAVWQTWMCKMNQQAKLKAAPADLLSRYLDTLRPPAETKPSAGITK